MKLKVFLTAFFFMSFAFADYVLTPGSAPLRLANGENVFCVNPAAQEYSYSCVCRHQFVDNISFGVTLKSNVTEAFLLGEGAVHAACAKIGYFQFQQGSIKVNVRECRRN